jgi:hypothetical protein
MPKVELIYARDCPNVAPARAHLLKAFAQTGLTPQWSEYFVGDSALPQRARGHGSPTILVDGGDVSGGDPGNEDSCRIYVSPQGGLSRVPAVQEIATALANSSPASVSRTSIVNWRSSLTVAPGIGVALVPTTLCPACWPALGGVLSTLGIGFVMDGRWVLPVTIPLLALAVGGLAFRAPTRRGYAPFGLGVVAVMIATVGKFIVHSDAAMYSGLAVLVAASVWNSWPTRERSRCRRCAGQA